MKKSLFMLIIAVFLNWTGCLADYEGEYTGTFSGGDRGTWLVTVDSWGNVSGWTYSSDGDFDEVSGTIESDGIAGFVAGGAEFSGSVNNAGYLSGKWTNSFWEISGTFTGRRLPVQLTVINGSGSGKYISGTKVTIRATVPVGMKFADWDDGTTNASYSITMPSTPITYTANFTDNAKPTVAITSPTALQKVFGTTGDFTVTGKATDNIALSDVMVKLNSDPFVSANATTNGLKNWNLTVTLTAGITNMISAYSVDTTGNSSATVTVKCVYTETGELTIVTNGSGKVTIAPAGPLLLGKKYKLTAAAGTGSVFANWTGDILTNTNKTTDFVMTANMTISANFTDTAKPTVTIKTPTASQKIFGPTGSFFTVTGTAADNLALSNVMVSVNGASAVPASTTTNGLKTWALPVILSKSLGGTNTIAAYSMDTAGHHSATVTVKCVYTETGALNIVTNGPGKVTVTPAGPLLLEKIYTLTAAAGAGAVFSNWIGDIVIDNPTSKVFKVMLGATNKIVTVTATFTDTAKPTVTISSPLKNAKLTNGTIVVQGTASDNGRIAQVNWRINNDPWQVASGTSRWSFSVDLMPAYNNLSVFAVDENGNCSTTNTITVNCLKDMVLTYFPMHDGDWKEFTGPAGAVRTSFSGGGDSYTENVDAEEMSSGETDYQYGTDSRQLLQLGGESGWTSMSFSPAILELDETRLINGGTLRSTSSTYISGYGNVSLAVNVSIVSVGTVTVPAGTYYDCKREDLVIKATVPSYGTYTASTASTVLAPRVGRIKIGIFNGTSLTGWEQLTAGTVNGVDVKDLAGQTAMAEPVAAVSAETAQPVSSNISIDAQRTSAPTSQAKIMVDGSSKDWTDIPRSTFSYSSVTQEVAVALDGNNIALLLNGCPFGISDTVLVYFKLRLSYGIGDNRHTVDLWTSGSVLYGMVDGRVITGLEAVLLNGVLEVKIPVEQAPSQVTIEEVGCGMDLGGGTMTELFKLTPRANL